MFLLSVHVVKVLGLSACLYNLPLKSEVFGSNSFSSASQIHLAPLRCGQKFILLQAQPFTYLIQCHLIRTEIPSEEEPNTGSHKPIPTMFEGEISGFVLLG